MTEEKKTNINHRLDCLVLKAWTADEAAAGTILTITEIVKRLPINVSQKKVEEMMDQYVAFGMFEETEKDKNLAYKPVSYTSQLDGIWE